MGHVIAGPTTTPARVTTALRVLPEREAPQRLLMAQVVLPRPGERDEEDQAA